MANTQLRVDGQSVPPECVHFIFQKVQFPGGHEYELRLTITEIDEESFEFGGFIDDKNPCENRVRDWMFWLGHIVSRLHDPNHCEGDVWVINTICSLTNEAGELVIKGQCSAWVHIDA